MCFLDIFCKILHQNRYDIVVKTKQSKNKKGNDKYATP